MTKLLRFLILAISSFFVMSNIAACSDDDDDRQVTTSQLPEKALSTIKQVFPGDKITRVYLDSSSDRKYEVYLQSGAEAEFDMSGEWTDLQAAIGKVLPSGTAPAPIESYINTNYPQYGIHEISRDARGYEVELVNGIDLEFDTQGNFIRIDH